MPASRQVLLFSLLASAVLMLPVRAAAQPRPTTIVASEPSTIRAWDSGIDSMLRTGNLEVRRVDADTLVSGRTHTRMRQLYRGVPVVGAELTRQTDDIGATVSIYGTTYPDINIEVSPALSVEDAAAIVLLQSGVELGPTRMPTLCVFPTANGFRLAYRASALSAEGGTAYVIDASDGSILQETDAVERQSAVGVGTGVLGDQKKMSVTSDSGTFNARDPLRPPLLTTYDLHENLQRTLDFLNGRITLGVSDRATDTDNTWSDGAAVDAHAQTGYFYDYYFKRFGRRGLDDNNFRLLSIEIGRAHV